MSDDYKRVGDGGIEFVDYNDYIDYGIYGNYDIRKCWLRIEPNCETINAYFHSPITDQHRTSQNITFPKTDDFDNVKTELADICNDFVGVDPLLSKLCIEQALKHIQEQPWYKKDVIQYDRCYEEDQKGNIRLDYSNIAHEIKKVMHVISFNEQLFVYENGIYVPGEVKIKQEILNISKKINYKKSLKTVTNEVLHRLLYDDPYYEYPFNKHKGILPVENGLLKFDFQNGNVKLMEHHPNYVFNYKLPVRYDPEQTHNDLYNDVLSKYLDGDEVHYLYQIPAQALLQMMGDAPFKKAYLIQGDSNAGKSTFLQLLNYLFGDENISGVSLHQLSDDKFAKASLEGRILNIHDDMSDIKLDDVGTFKNITGRFVQEVEKKNVQSYQAYLKAVHVFACNVPPNFNNKIKNDSAFWERWEYIHFTNLFRKDPDFVNNYFTEESLSGFLNKIIEYMIYIYNHGLIFDSTAAYVRDVWEYDADPLRKFIDENMDSNVSEPMLIDQEKLFNEYLRFCQNEDIKEEKIPGTINMLTRRIFKYGVTTRRVGSGDDKKTYYYMPYNWKDGSSYYVEPFSHVSQRGD
ncbi:MAG: DNA primase family protein [Petrotogales bacterium]